MEEENYRQHAYDNDYDAEIENEDEMEDGPVFNSEAYTSIPLNNNSAEQSDKNASAADFSDNVYSAFNAQSRSAGSWQQIWNNPGFSAAGANGVNGVYVLELKKSSDAVALADLIKQKQYIILFDVAKFESKTENDFAYVVNFLDGVCYATESKMTELRKDSGLYMISHSDVDLIYKFGKRRKF